MSKFFDETQKAQQWAPSAPETGGLDVVSVINAIKQDATDVETINTDRQGETGIDAGKPIKAPLRTRNGNDPLPPSAVEAFGSLRTRVMKLHASKGIRSLMLTSAVPGEGKTSTALNLAVSCAKLHNLRILLVDGDLRSRGMSRLLEIPEGPGLSDLLAGKAAADMNIMATDQDNLAVLGAGSLNEQPSELFASQRWGEFISWASQSYGIVIVDAPPIHSISDAELISAGCDGILIVVRALSTPREIAQKSVSRMDKRKVVGVVFNGLPSSPGTDYRYYGKSS